MSYLGGDELETAPLPVLLLLDELGDGGVALLDGGVPEGVDLGIQFRRHDVQEFSWKSALLGGRNLSTRAGRTYHVRSPELTEEKNRSRQQLSGGA